MTYKQISSITLKKDGVAQTLTPFDTVPDGYYTHYCLLPYSTGNVEWSTTIEQTATTPATYSIYASGIEQTKDESYNGTSVTYTFDNTDWLTPGNVTSISYIIKEPADGVDYNPENSIFASLLLVEYGPVLGADVGSIEMVNATTATHTLSQNGIVNYSGVATDIYSGMYYDGNYYTGSVQINVTVGNSYDMSIVIKRDWNGDGDVLFPITVNTVQG